MIKISNLFKSFAQTRGGVLDKQVLTDISLTINKGETVSIIGPSGSGKSTLLRMINRLEAPTAGSIFIDDVELTEKTAAELVKKTGMVFQLFNLFENMTLLENIAYAPQVVLKKTESEAKELAANLLQTVGLSGQVNQLPSQLSGGQKQRAGIARALAMNPQIMLFDEVTSALDPEMVKEVLNVIKRLAHAGMTIILVTHEMGFAREISDRIIFMDHGKIIADQPAAKFFEEQKNPRIQDFLSKVL